MITAMQKARLDLASRLSTARDVIGNAPSSIAIDEGTRADIHKIIETIDRVLNRMIPNEPVKDPAP